MEELADILKRLGTRDTTADSPPLPPAAPGENGDEECPRCGGRGWLTMDVPVGHPEFGQAVTCECQRERVDQERHSRLLRYSNLAHLKRFTFEAIKPEGLTQDAEDQRLFKEGHLAALEYSEKLSGWLVFTGPNGSGKTHLAAAIGNRCIERGHVAFFTHVADLLDHLRATYAPTSEVAYSDLFDLVKSTPLLILDGLGAHSATPWADEKLRQVINHRYNAELPTVFTTSAALDELDPYILGRMNTTGLSRVLELRRPAERTDQLGRIEPQMFRRMSFDSFDVRGNNPSAAQRASLEAAHQFAKSFAADPDGWLTLFGDTGVGKTHLAVAIAAEQIKRGRPATFAFVPELLDHLRNTFSPDSSVTYDSLFEEVKNTPLLILDDLGQERSSPWANEKLYQIIVHRHNARLPTVVTSMVDFAKERGPIGSRVQDPSAGEMIKMDAPDYRNKRRASPRQRRTGGGRAAR